MKQCGEDGKPAFVVISLLNSSAEESKPELAQLLSNEDKSEVPFLVELDGDEWSFSYPPIFSKRKKKNCDSSDDRDGDIKETRRSAILPTRMWRARERNS